MWFPRLRLAAVVVRAALSVGALLLATSLVSPTLAQTASPSATPTAAPGPPSTPTPAATPTATPTATPSPAADASPAPASKGTESDVQGPITPLQWAVNFDPAALYAEADEGSEKLTSLRQFTYLGILGYEDVWARVYDPRTRRSGYVRSEYLGPVEAPPAYIVAPPPPAVEAIDLPGRVVKNAWIAFYPTPAEEAQTARLGHNAPVFIAESVVGDDGELWYRTGEGDYLPSAAVRLPRAPSRTFSGRWIDADLAEPAMLTAYEDDQAVLSSLVIKGAGSYQTPQGLFSIQRRVFNETMSSETIGIPRGGPGGYYLKDVLFTQYFLGSGESIHYNYWSSVWGYAGSHGCLGLPYEESAFLWNWATVGTPVSVHY